jgi:hypothetical protein
VTRIPSASAAGAVDASRPDAAAHSAARRCFRLIGITEVVGATGASAATSSSFPAWTVSHPCYSRGMVAYTIVPRRRTYWIEQVDRNGARQVVERHDTELQGVERLRVLQERADAIEQRRAALAARWP